LLDLVRLATLLLLPGSPAPPLDQLLVLLYVTMMADSFAGIFVMLF
jgi:hypothetical protein